MATATTHKFKSAFAGKDFSGFPLVVGDKTKLVTAANLTDEDVPLLQRHGGGHLIEPIAGASQPAQPDEQPATAAAFPTEFPADFSYEKLVSDVADEVVRRIGADTQASSSADGVQTTNSATLQTAVEHTDEATIVKHSSGGPDDLPITAPAAEQAHATLPEALPEEAREEKPAAQTDPKPHKPKK